MEKNAQITLPEYLDCAAFLVEDSIITQANKAAELCFVTVGTDVTQLIPDGLDEYKAYQTGKLYLSLEIHGMRYTATVVNHESAQLFCFSQEGVTPEMHMLWLVSIQMKSALQSALSGMELLQRVTPAAENPEAAELIGLVNHNLYKLLRDAGNMGDVGPYSELRKSNFKYLDMKAVLAEINEKLTAKLSGIKRNFKFTGLSVPVYTMMDAQSIERAICNLVSNAIKFSKEGGTITTTAKYNGNRVSISVENSYDNPKLPINQLFDRYLRTPGLEDPRYGIGLGLPITRSIAIAHNGTLLIDQRTPDTIRFTLTMGVVPDSTSMLFSPLAPRLNFDGGFDTPSVELSQVLPDKMYENL